MKSNDRHITPIELLSKHFAKETNANEDKELLTWRNSHAKNEEEYLALKKLWGLVEAPLSPGQINLDQEWRKMEKTIVPSRNTRHLFPKIIQIAAMIAVISTLAFITIRTLRISSTETQLAETTQLELPDGSTISLNAQSKLSYSKGFGEKHRRIKLKGEGYFEVEKNPDIPFIVSVHNLKVQVVGTKFNIKAQNDKPEIRILVTEGTVEVSNIKTGRKILVNAGEQATFTKAVNKLTKSGASNNNDIAWKTLELEFDETPLSEVVDVLNNVYHSNLSVDKLLHECPISVDFTGASLDAILKVIQSTYNVSYRKGHKEKSLHISGKSCH